jgi:hypothetical protein
MNPDNTSRILLGLVEALNKTPVEAEAVLTSLTLRIVATPVIATSAAAQAGLLTAINAGKRCFLGGVRVEGLDNPIELKVPYAPFATLNEVVDDLLPINLASPSFTETIFIGERTDSTTAGDWVAYCAGWRGGVTVGRIPVAFQVDPVTDFSLGGVYAGALAVHHAFMRAAQLSHRLEGAHGISLWNLDDGWMSIAGDGPKLGYLPSALWLIGLGHLGQAYLWALGLLPFSKPADCQLMLQDIDILAEANQGAALLGRDGDVGKRKTRICREWLDARGFAKSLVCDRAFDCRTVRCSDVGRTEPHIALCGLDNREGRRHLGSAKFLYVLECGLGGFAADFDQIGFHSFPNMNIEPAKFWHGDVSDKPNRTRQKILEETLGACGAVPFAKVAISSSFVGAVAASFTVAELLRMYHDGRQCWDGEISLRSRASEQFQFEFQPYDSLEIARYGWLEIR